MSKEPEKLVCDWCKKPIEDKEKRCEVKVFNKGEDNDGNILDCCPKCFQDLKPKDLGKKRGLSLQF